MNGCINNTLINHLAKLVLYGINIELSHKKKNSDDKLLCVPDEKISVRILFLYTLSSL